MEDIISGTYFADDTGKIMIVKLQGYIDQTNSYGLQKVFNDIINSECFNVIIDFSEVMYISSAGWGIFVGEIKHFRDEGGDIKLSNMSPDIYEVYQMLEFYHIFEDYNSVESAKNSFSGLDFDKEQSLTEENNQPSSMEIDLDEDIVSENPTENILEISMTNPSEDATELQISEVEGKEEFSENIDITIDENIETKVDSVSLSSLHSEEEIEKDQNREISNPVIDLSRLPLNEKIKKLIAEYPLLSIWKIKKLLRDNRFGTVKINIFKLYKTLKELDLESKIKRYRYYRSS